MKKNLKVSEIFNAYNVIGKAKYQKLEDSDKVKVWKISRQLKPIALQFEEEKEDATKSFYTEELIEKVRKGQQYEDAKKEGASELPMTEQEYKEAIKEIVKAKALVEKALSESLAKEVELEFEPISEEALGLLMASNDWNMAQVDMIEFIVQ